RPSAGRGGCSHTVQDEAVQASLAAQAQARRRAARSAASELRGLAMNDDGPPDKTTG
ncbi:hypothetical protein THAOC_30963, partial [Thalassiosira oceanica]